MALAGVAAIDLAAIAQLVFSAASFIMAIELFAALNRVP